MDECSTNRRSCRREHMFASNIYVLFRIVWILRRMSKSIPAPVLAARILAGKVPASAAIGRPDLYEHLNAGAAGLLPFLGSSAKIDAGMSVGILSTVLYMQPAQVSGREACAGRSPGCTAACLAEGTGRMSMHASQRARRRRHASFFSDRLRFLAALHTEIAAHEKRAAKQGKIAAVRLNGTTDLPFHRMGYVAPDGRKFARLHDAFPAVRFYEYTKHALSSQARGAGIPENLSLTFSVSERPDAETLALEYLQAGYGAAVVTFTERHIVPPSFNIGRRKFATVDGDAHDARFLDPAGSVVILAAKGRAKTDASGFVKSVPTFLPMATTAGR